MAREIISANFVELQAAKIWQRGDLHRAFLENSTIFPLKISLPNLSAKVLLEQFSAVQNAIYLLQTQSKKHGFTHRQLGEQKIPVAVEFENKTLFLRFLNQQKTFAEFTFWLKKHCNGTQFCKNGCCVIHLN
jgi:hypothetical protein